jgi:hypothetical protein
MKQNKLYVTPKVDVIEIEPQGILCASVPAPVDFTGTGMEFTRGYGNW